MSVTRVVAANRLNLENGNIFDTNVWIVLVEQDRMALAGPRVYN